jgi:eukaryotic translation initiation factor 2C
MKGVYQSIRAAQGRHLVINVDVSNTCFWHQQVITVLAFQLCECTGMDQVGNAIQPVQARGGVMRESPAFTALKRLHKNEFRVQWRGIPDSIARKTFKILRVSDKNSRQYKFDLKERETGEIIPDVSVEEYFKRKYNLALQWPEFPVLETTKKGVVYPMECSIMLGGQRYPYKLTETQTSNMIKFAVSRPADRKESIRKGLDLLKWDTDPFLSNYGLKIDRNMLKTEARVLNPPTVLFGKKVTVAPGFSGRWDLRGKQFLFPNHAPLKSWGVCIIKGPRPTPLEAVQAFIRDFIKIYRGHGGIVENTTPVIHQNVTDGGKAVENLFLAVGNACQFRPQIMFFVLPTKNADMYNRIKKSADCRYGVVSQCVNVNHVFKNQPQYHSNLAMKVNAKLGGTTCRVNLASPTGHFKVPTMIIGADVSHAAPGSQAASFAAFTVSMDPAAVRYAAAVETNGVRVEMIATRNIEDMLRPLLMEWSMNTGQGQLPKHVYYFRDGVSEGQYQNVLKQEVADMKRLMNQIGQHNKNLDVGLISPDSRGCTDS